MWFRMTRHLHPNEPALGDDNLGSDAAVGGVPVRRHDAEARAREEHVQVPESRGER